jgi:hypothetical protein
MLGANRIEDAPRSEGSRGDSDPNRIEDAPSDEVARGAMIVIFINRYDLKINKNYPIGIIFIK